MAIRVYLLPIVPHPARANGRVPKYLIALGVPWGGMDYGLEPVMLVVADVTAAQHAALAANADVVSVPANLDAPIGAGALNAARSALEALGIPAQWLVASTTWREAVRHVARVFQLAQRFHGLYGVRLYRGGVTLNTTVARLTAGQRAALLDAATSLGWDVSGVQSDWTLRHALKALSDQWGAPVLIGGVEI